jgi:hypothetical protein
MEVSGSVNTNKMSKSAFHKQLLLLPQFLNYANSLLSSESITIFAQHLFFIFLFIQNFVLKFFSGFKLISCSLAFLSHNTVSSEL